MKRSFNILMALMLSLMVVIMSVGTTVTHCLLSHKVMVGMVQDCCLEPCVNHKHHLGHQHGAQVKKHCMDVKQLKLSPTQSFQSVDFNASPVFAGILPSSWMTLPRPVACLIQNPICWHPNASHLPPRAYLRLLNTLII